MIIDAYCYGQEHATLLHDRELQASFYSLLVLPGLY